MTHKELKSMQKSYGYDHMQSMIDSGMAWRMEGAIGRQAMSTLECGACMLPKHAHYGPYGNRVPSRDELKKGTKGTFQNAVRFWTGVKEGNIFLEL